MKKALLFLPLFLLISCGNGNNSNSSDTFSTTSSENSIPESISSNSEETSSSVTTSDDSLDETNTYTVKGYFKDNKDNPISNLTLGLHNEDKVLLDSVLTDAEGKFNFIGVKEGSYYIQILKADSSKYKNLDKKFNFTVTGDFEEVSVGPFILEIDDTSWSDLV